MVPASAANMTSDDDMAPVLGTDVERTDFYGDPLPPGVLARAGTVRLWHPGGAWAIAFSPKESLLASAGRDPVVRLWSSESGAQVARLVGHEGMVNSVGFTPDGAHLLSAGRDGTVRTWDIHGVFEMRRFTLGDNPLAVCVSPDALELAVAMAGAACVQLLDVRSGRLLRTFSLGDCTPARTYLAFSPTGSVLAALSMDGHTREAKTFFAWDMQTGQRVFSRESGTLLNHGFLAFDPRGRFVVVPESAPEDSLGFPRPDCAAVYDIATWQVLAELPEVRAATVLASGEIAYEDNLGLWLPSGRVEGARRVDAACGPCLTEMVASDASALVARAGERAPILTVSTESGETLLPEVPRTAITSVVFSPDSRRILTLCENDDVLREYDAASGALLQTKALMYTAFDQRQALAGGCALELEDEPSGVRLWDWTNEASVLLAGAKRCGPSVFSRNGRHLAIVVEKWICVFAVATGEVEHRVKVSRSESFHFDVANDGLVVIWAGGKKEGTAPWIARGAGARMAVNALDEWPPRAELSPDGRFLAAPWRYCEPSVLDVATGLRLELPGAPESATAVAFSPQAQSFAAGALDGSVVVLDRLSGTRSARVSGHDGAVTAIAFSPDAGLLATGGEDATILIARVPTPR